MFLWNIQLTENREKIKTTYKHESIPGSLESTDSWRCGDGLDFHAVLYFKARKVKWGVKYTILF